MYTHVLRSGPQAKQNTVAAIQRFLAKYGFRCINELKLEESTLHDDPGTVGVARYTVGVARYIGVVRYGEHVQNVVRAR